VPAATVLSETVCDVPSGSVTFTVTALASAWPELAAETV